MSLLRTYDKSHLPTTSTITFVRQLKVCYIMDSRAC